MRKKKKNRELGKVQQQLAVKVAAGLLSIQKRWAVFMSSLFEGMSQGKQIAIFISVGIALLCYNSILVYRSTVKVPANRQAVVHIPTTSDTLNKKAVPIRLNFEQLERLLVVGDSLKKIGGKQWKKFEELYPVIADSIRIKEAGSQ